MYVVDCFAVHGFHVDSAESQVSIGLTIHAGALNAGKL